MKTTPDTGIDVPRTHSNDIMDAEALLPDRTIHAYRIVPLDAGPETIRVGAARPEEKDVTDALAFQTGRRVEWVELDADVVDAYFNDREPTGASNGTGGIAESLHEDTRLDAGALGRGTVVQQVKRIIQRGIAAGASDIHIEPYETHFRVRYRLDGVLQRMGELDLMQRDAVVSRLKIMAGLDIAEKRRPQDSRIRVGHDGRNVDLRVSTLPTAHGEKVVLRILDKQSLRLDLGALGFGGDDRARFERAIQRPNGQILVTGPTGSGKTTTLYAALNALNTSHINITTIEDPIEYDLAGINQTRVRPDIGFTFAQALRAFLRQDPDVIMVGEIRDQETARIAVRAALTGHRVLSTLHTNDAPSAVTRLTDMGVEPYLVASSVRLVVAQRLVRRTCPDCAEERAVDVSLLASLALPPDTRIRAGAGCARCNETGFRGRTALFEILSVNDPMAELIAEEADTYRIREQARADGMQTLREAAAEKVRTGVTTPREVLREIGP